MKEPCRLVNVKPNKTKTVSSHETEPAIGQKLTPQNPEHKALRPSGHWIVSLRQSFPPSRSQVQSISAIAGSKRQRKNQLLHWLHCGIMIGSVKILKVNQNFVSTDVSYHVSIFQAVTVVTQSKACVTRLLCSSEASCNCHPPNPYQLYWFHRITSLPFREYEFQWRRCPKFGVPVLFSFPWACWW